METFMYRGTMDKIFFLIKNYILMYEKEIGGPRAYTQALGACLIEVRCQDENIIVWKNAKWLFFAIEFFCASLHSFVRQVHLLPL